MMLQLASEGLLDALSGSMSDGPQASHLLLFAVGAVTLIILIAVAARFLNTEKSPDSESGKDYLTLFVDVLGLSEQDRRDLCEIGRRTHLLQPAAMLLSPMNLSVAVHAAAVGEGAVDLLKRTEQLCQRIFDTSLPAPPDQTEHR